MATERQILAGKKGRTDGFEYESLLVETIERDFGYSAKEFPQYHDAKVGNKKSRSKTDIVVATENSSENLSVKNPKTYSTSIQMQIVSRGILNDILKQDVGVTQDWLEFCDLFFGGKDVAEHADAAGIDFASLDYESEQRRKRLKCSSIPDSVVNGALSFLNRSDVKDAILSTVLSEGNVLDTQAHAMKMLWCDSRTHGKGNSREAILVDIARLISSVSSKYEWKIKPSQTVLALGPLTLQMKGSGKKGGTSYHSMQFNASIKDIIDNCPNAVVSEGTLSSVVGSIFNK